MIERIQELISNRFNVIIAILTFVFVQKGARFTIRDGEVTLGTGVVTETFKSMDPKEREVFLKGKTRKQKEAQQQRLQELEEEIRKKRMEEELNK